MVTLITERGRIYGDPPGAVLHINIQRPINLTDGTHEMTDTADKARLVRTSSVSSNTLRTKHLDCQLVLASRL